jgi:hypothetical protein
MGRSQIHRDSVAYQVATVLRQILNGELRPLQKISPAEFLAVFRNTSN